MCNKTKKIKKLKWIEWKKIVSRAVQNNIGIWNTPYTKYKTAKMPPAKDWGRKAVGKFDKRLEDDELFKEIGGQLDASNFDYSQWQRKGGKPPGDAKTQKKSLPPMRYGKASDGFTVSSGPDSWASPHANKSEAEAPCRHGRWKEKEKKQSINAAYEEALAKKKAEQIKILQLRVRARKQTITEYRKRQAELLISNMELRDLIIVDEKEAHEDVKKLLRKYEKYRGGINTLNEQFVGDLADAKILLEETKHKVEKDIAVVQKQVDDMDVKLQSKQKDLNTLINYKDKEYPVKSLQISELQNEIAELKFKQEEEKNELNHIVETELEKFYNEDQQRTSEITEKATEEVISRMHPSLKDMATQNVVMTKEIEFHVKEIEDLKDQNDQLDMEVKAMIKDPKTSIRQQMFPEFYPTREKCTPDMEVVLDIPTQEWLPI